MNINSIEISIIVPILNAQRYINQCLTSLISQSLKNFEIICVDGGSTDGTLEIIKDYQRKDSRIVVIESQVKSYGYQMNLGIKIARGEYIGIVEADDYIDFEMYQRLLDKARNVGRVDFIKGGYFEFSDSIDGCRLSKIVNIPEEMKEKPIDLNKCNYYRLSEINHIWSGIYKKSFIIKNSIRFNETPGASFQDTSFSILVGLLADTCIYTNDNFYYYRIDNPMSSVKSNSKIECVVDEFRFIDDELTKRGKLSVENRIAVQKKKLIVYKWNCLRLSQEGRTEFLKRIQDELKVYSQDYIKKKLNQEEIVSYRLLTSSYELECYEKKQIEIRKNLEEVCKILLEGKLCVLVGCGSLGEKILLMQRLLKKKTIVVACDNSVNKHKSQFHGYVIEEVEYAVSIFPEATYIVANKYRNSEIVCQLNNMGINNIFSVREMLPLSEIVHLCSKYYG